LANLTKANLIKADLTEADLRETPLTGAYLSGTTLTKANLTMAKLTKANLGLAILTGANLAFADLTGAVYAPASPPPDSYLEGIKGLSTVTFPEDSGSGLVQLRELLQKVGLRDLERQATYAFESNKTWHAITGRESKPVDWLEGGFRFLFFETTTGYGLYPGHALWIIFRVWAVLILVYIWPIRRRPRSPNPASGIYRIWPSDRIETGKNEVKLGTSAKVERLQGKSWWRSFGYAAQFSLLSAFHIGWKDFNVGSWIARLQSREYALRATGWVRVVSGIQSLLSVYLLAIWALTYFGRPFQ
jgi:hypothetical protein